MLLTASALVTDNALDGSETPAEFAPEVCQIAILRNSFTIQYMRREVAGGAMRLWLCAGEGAGYVEIPSEQIEAFEDRKNPAPLAPAAPASTPETFVRDMLPAKDSIQNLIASAASRYQIDPDFVTSVVEAESGFNPSAVSPKGAKGLVQLMPRTAASLGVEDVLDPAANVEAGTKYLRRLLDQYDGDVVLALTAYNAGPQRAEQYGDTPKSREIREYVARVVDNYNRKKLQQHSTEAPVTPQSTSARF